MQRISRGIACLLMCWLMLASGMARASTPIYASSVLASDGKTLTVTFSTGATIGLLPATGVTGFTVWDGGMAQPITSVTASSLANTVTINLTSAIGSGDSSVRVAYTGGNLTDNAATPVAATTFTEQTVTNNSVFATAQTYAVLSNVDFSTVGNIAAGTIGTPATIGSTGYYDYYGGWWKVLSGVLQSAFPRGANYQWAGRVAGEDVLQERIVALTAPVASVTDEWELNVRYNRAAHQYYTLIINGSNKRLEMRYMNLTALTFLSSGTINSLTLVVGHQYITHLTAIYVTSTTSTTVTCSIADAAAPLTSLASLSITGRTDTGTQAAGGMGVDVVVGPSTFSRLQTFQVTPAPPPSPLFTPSTTSVVQNTLGNSIVFTGQNTSWVSGTTLSLDGTSIADGASISSQVVNVGAQTITAVIRARATISTNMTFSDSTDAATTTLSVVVNPLVTIPPGVYACAGSSQYAYFPLPVTAGQGLLCQTVHDVRLAFTHGRLLWINNNAQALTITASLKVGILGTKVQVLFGGVTSGTIPAYGTLLSDDTGVSASVSTATDYSDRVFVDTYMVVPAGMTSLNCGQIAGGNPISSHYLGGILTNTTDLTMNSAADSTSGAMTGTGYYVFGPFQVMAKPTGGRHACLVGIGDSITQNPSYDATYVNASTGASGLSWLQQVGAYLGLPTINLGVSATSTSDFLATNPSAALWRSLTMLGSDFINFFGHNDFAGGGNAAGLITNQSSIRAILPSTLRYYLGTLTASSTLASGAWATVTDANQTPSSFSAQLTSYNATLRATPTTAGAYSSLLMGDLSESGTTRGLWAAGYTEDGVHSIGVGGSGGIWFTNGEGRLAQGVINGYSPNWLSTNIFSRRKSGGRVGTRSGQ